MSCLEFAPQVLDSLAAALRNCTIAVAARAMQHITYRGRGFN